ncbi:MAG: deoxyribodipyrimidine photo-lyase [Spirochaetes bacterium]|nr:deoxyribodipyrimidine photo-lyase [Spirochaetota bacterium]
MIQEQRIRALNQAKEQKGSYVLYWMQQSQRAVCNHALEFAIEAANRLSLPVVVFFGITPFPESNARHYAFMLEGLQEVRDYLARRGILFAPRIVFPVDGAASLAEQASLAVTDRGYLRVQKEWRRAAAERMVCPLVQVESDVIVPVETASGKEEYSAGTFRPRITRYLYAYLRPLAERECLRDSLDMDIERDDIDDAARIIRMLDVDTSVRPVQFYRGGSTEALRHLDTFIDKRLDQFAELRNDPGADCSSNLSPYLHFGQISPLQTALAVIDSSSPGKDRFLEELIVRRELAANFVHYNPVYDTFRCLPEWSRKTLSKHVRDRREYHYTTGELEAGNTHDRYWNAAQREMVFSGKMHGYMRMYWGKKILEWSATPEAAFETALTLNNRYNLDGRDPNGFAGVAWCFGKHDRAWPERAVFGKIRYMNDRGLERKFDMDAYCARANALQ